MFLLSIFDRGGSKGVVRAASVTRHRRTTAARYRYLPFGTGMTMGGSWTNVVCSSYSLGVAFVLPMQGDK